jgi:hypothetical protein
MFLKSNLKKYSLVAGLLAISAVPAADTTIPLNITDIVMPAGSTGIVVRVTAPGDDGKITIIPILAPYFKGVVSHPLPSDVSILNCVVSEDNLKCHIP